MVGTPVWLTEKNLRELSLDFPEKFKTQQPQAENCNSLLQAGDTGVLGFRPSASSTSKILIVLAVPREVLAPYFTSS